MKKKLKKTSLIEALKLPKPLVVNKFSITSLNAVTNPNEIRVASDTMKCRQNEVNFELNVAVAMRKGTEKAATPKAMGEDAFVLDLISINFQNKNYEIPIMATLDGGGGHTLAQFGREEITSAFKKHLMDLINVHGKLDSAIICRAMKKTDAELFERMDAEGNFTFSGRGYAKLKENHAAVEEKFGISFDVFKGVFQNLTAISENSKKLQLNPMEIHREVAKNSDINPLVRINGKEYDLRDEATAKMLQVYYEKSMGTEEKIEVQVVMNAFFVNERKEVECVTYNRGDSMALHAESEELKALSKPVVSLQSHQSHTILKEGDRVISMCDGVHEVISINELEEANKSDFLKGKSSEDYVTALMQASIQSGSGDDKTIVSAKIKVMGS